MDSLDKMLSEIVSPFDETETDQSDVNEKQYLQYRKNALVQAIGKIKGFQEFDLYWEDILNELELDDTRLFLTICLHRLAEIYPVDILIDYINTDNILENDLDGVIKLIHFFVYDEWMEYIVLYMPYIDIPLLKSPKLISNKVKEGYFKTQEKILNDDNIHSLIRYHFEFCTRTQGERTIMIWIGKDITGVVSRQLVLNKKEE